MAWSSILSRQARRCTSASLSYRIPLPCSSFSSSSSSRIPRSIPSSLTFSTSSSSFHGDNSRILLGASALLGSLTLIFGYRSSDNRTALAEVAQPPPAPPSPSRSMATSTATGGPVVCKSGRIITKLRIFVGYDPREDLAFEVCRHSILKHATIPVEVIPIKQAELRRTGIYSRNKDPTESTEFSFTRFLTPYLTGYEGWAMFVDCDFLYTADIRELMELIDDKYAIMCVQHDYTPKTATKMDGVVQTTYPRKNWSSMVLYNCSHPKNRVLTPAVVNSQSGAFLHRFMWLDDKDIGSIPFTWNFLVGHNEMPQSGSSSHVLPKAIHYTSGGPWFEAWQNCGYAREWQQESEEYRRTHMIQKIIQSELVSLLDRRFTERESKLEERVAEMESRLKEVTALQRLLLFYLQERMLPANGYGNGNGKEVPSLKPEDVDLLEERFAVFKSFGKD